MTGESLKSGFDPGFPSGFAEEGHLLAIYFFILNVARPKRFVGLGIEYKKGFLRADRLWRLMIKCGMNIESAVSVIKDETSTRNPEELYTALRYVKNSAIGKKARKQIYVNKGIAPRFVKSKRPVLNSY